MTPCTGLKKAAKMRVFGVIAVVLLLLCSISLGQIPSGLAASHFSPQIDRARSPRIGGGGSHVGQVFCVMQCTLISLIYLIYRDYPIEIRVKPGTYIENYRKKAEPKQQAQPSGSRY